MAHDPNDRILQGEATLFGKEFLRMAGIVQMLHAIKPPYDKYPYAHRKRVRAEPGARTQVRSRTTVSLAVPGPCATVLAVPHHTLSHRVLTCHVWPILRILLVYKRRP